VKRLNPKTDKPFRYGDTKEDGLVFFQYRPAGKKSPDGYFKEQWISQERYETHKETNACAHFRRQYGITKSERDYLILQSNFVCDICGDDSVNKFHGTLVIDHCHETGQVRGVLCNTCNIAIGCIENSKVSLDKFYKAAKRYLNFPPAQRNPNSWREQKQ
jgi:quinol monooxygenase YgiN